MWYGSSMAEYRMRHEYQIWETTTPELPYPHPTASFTTRPEAESMLTTMRSDYARVNRTFEIRTRLISDWVPDA